MLRNVRFLTGGLVGLLIMVSSSYGADTLHLSSPSGKLKLDVWMGKQLYYTVRSDGRPILEGSAIDFFPEGKPSLGSAGKISASTVRKVYTEIISPVPEKRRIIPDKYNELTLRFKQPYRIEFRVYDDGVAYRILTTFKDSVIVNNELAEFRFPGKPSGYFPEIADRKGEDMFMTSFEDTYNYKAVDSFPLSSIAYTPVLITAATNPKIAITESDLEDYPGMFLTGTGGPALKGIFAGYPIEEKTLEALYSQIRVAKRAPYIARTKGTRSYPWRVMIISQEDKELPSNDIVYRLASPSRVNDVSWVKPGNITDEWIINLNLFNVPFKAGLNTASYKYYIDFAFRFGFDRIMMDAGWSNNNDLFQVIPEINMDTLVAYAKEKGVKIAMWTLGMTLDRQLDSALKQFNKWGIDFIMTDFIDRDDQKGVGFHHRIAKACADHKIMIMFHGSYPPKGFNRTYPNAVAREAVLGSEYNMWSNRVSPEHDVQLAFIRMLAGPLDYEPGMLSNATIKSFHNAEGYVMSLGTRSHQLSMYVVYDSPIQFFAGNPSQGLLEPEYMELLASIPTTWDETKILNASVGEYIVTARKHDRDWYIGGMTNWTERDLDLDLSFLEEGEYAMTICKDGPNAEKYAADYQIEQSAIRKGGKQIIHLAPGGGFLIKLKKKN